MPNELVVNAVFERDTKHALVYQEVDADEVPLDEPGTYKIGRVYIRKAAFGRTATPPARITITVTSRDEVRKQPARSVRPNAAPRKRAAAVAA